MQEYNAVYESIWHQPLVWRIFETNRGTRYKTLNRSLTLTVNYLTLVQIRLLVGV